MYRSRYNVFNAAGQVLYGPGDEIDQAEAVRQGIEPLPDGMILEYDGEVAQLVAVEAEQPEQTEQPQEPEQPEQPEQPAEPAPAATNRKRN